MFEAPHMQVVLCSILRTLSIAIIMMMIIIIMTVTATTIKKTCSLPIQNVA